MNLKQSLLSVVIIFSESMTILFDEMVVFGEIGFNYLIPCISFCSHLERKNKIRAAIADITTKIMKKS